MNAICPFVYNNPLYQFKLIRWLIGGEWYYISDKNDARYWIPRTNAQSITPLDDIKCLKIETH